MSKTKRSSLQLQLYKIQTSIGGLILGALLVLAGFLVLWWGETVPVDEHARWRSFLLGVGGVLAATGLLSVGWDVFGKRSLRREVLAAAGLGSDVESSGLRGISTDYRTVIDWDEMIRRSEDINIAAAWANTWREQHTAAWSYWANRGGGTAHILLPDLENEEVVQEVARRFRMGEDRVRAKIADAVTGFSTIDRVELRYTDVPLVWTFYGFSNQAVVTMHTISKSKEHNVPALVLDPTGSVGKFFVSQFEAAWEAARVSADRVG